MNIEMSKSVTVETVILSAIRTLRARKARPNRDRILKIVSRTHGIDTRSAESELNNMVDKGLLERRSFKGAISFRVCKGDKTALGRSNSSNNQGMPNRNHMRQRLDEAIRSVDPSEIRGATFDEIEAYFSRVWPQYSPNTTMLRARLRAALRYSIEHGRFRKTGRFYQVAVQRLESRSLTPSEPSLNEDVPQCFCGRTYPQNTPNPLFSMLLCRGCGARVHARCKYPLEVAARVVQLKLWQCDDCKTCCVCDGSSKWGGFLVCDHCDQAYHSTCHKPIILAKPEPWSCMACHESERNGTPMVYVLDSDVHNVASYQPSVAPSNEAEESEPPTMIKQRGILPSEGEEATCRGTNGYYQPRSPEHQAPQVVPRTSMATPALHPVRPMTGGDPGGPLPLPVPSLPVVPILGTTAYTGQDQSTLPTSARTPCDSRMVERTSIGSITTLPGSYPIPMMMPMNPRDSLTRIPGDVMRWSVTDVGCYLRWNGFMNESLVFEEQEIDGRSLSYLTREDLIARFGFKLGTALKVFHALSKLPISREGPCFPRE